MNEKNLRSQIQEFLNSVPSVNDVIGYGSGVKEQKNYSTSYIKNIDIIATVDNDILWHKENKEKHKEDYSVISRISNIPLCHFGTDINYLAHLEYNNNLFKLGIVNKQDLLDDLKNWKNFYLAGRLQKSILEVRIDDEVKSAIDLNRKNALIVALILNYGKQIDIYELLYSICNLSFKKDIRMRYQMENPNKVKNILEGTYEELKDIYDILNEDYYLEKDNTIIPNYNLITDKLDNLPKELVDYLKDYDVDLYDVDIKDLKMIKELIVMYLDQKNLKTSTIQPIKSILLNPMKKNMHYAFQKRMKYKGK